MGEHVRAGELDIWVEQVGEGPDVLLIGGGGDTVESWQFQLDGLADRYRLTAFDNRGAGRTAMPGGSVSVEMMADDAAQVLRALKVPSAHVAGFSGGSIIAQELALRHPQLVRSLVLQSTWPVMDSYLRSWLLVVRWLVEVAPSERAFLEGFYLDIYTARAHNDGTVAQIIEEVLAFPHKQTTEDLQHYLDAFLDHDTTDRLPTITAPTLVLAGGRDSTARPELCRAVADLIPGARYEGHGGGGPPALPGGTGGVESPRRRVLAQRRSAGLTSLGNPVPYSPGSEALGCPASRRPTQQFRCSPRAAGRCASSTPPPSLEFAVCPTTPRSDTAAGGNTIGVAQGDVELAIILVGPQCDMHVCPRLRTTPQESTTSIVAGTPGDGRLDDGGPARKRGSMTTGTKPRWTTSLQSASADRRDLRA